ncbi:hypothetical protein MOE57_14355 [Bacillus inaquosorum]|uniref:hypothetical protein n=1 Tax=Bacillus inaquosorum TaxID=483913 RepID=UPI0022807B32|nr:hypothetical protein [Bacillus inaquosorum]MCY9083650.1 hypothetical protein [Bacillus inaquosorum]
MKNEIADLRCTIAGLIAENERLKTENKMLIGELATIRDMLPDEYGFEEGTVEYAVCHPEGVKDLVKQTLERMKGHMDINLWLYEEADKNICDLMELLDKCLLALDKSKTGYSELSKAIRREIESFYI